MEERREMNEQRMMTREELEMRLPALNHIAEQRDAKFRLRYAEKTVNNGIERGYTLDAGTRVSVNVYQNESWAQMPDEELFDTLNDLDGKYCVTEDQETIGERLNALFKSGELFEKIYPVVVSENNTENFTEAGITFDRYLDICFAEGSGSFRSNSISEKYLPVSTPSWKSLIESIPSSPMRFVSFE